MGLPVNLSSIFCCASLVGNDFNDVLAVQATFFLGFFFPPPTPSSFMFLGTDGPSAGLAADGNKAVIVEGVVRHLIDSDVLPHIC